MTMGPDLPPTPPANDPTKAAPKNAPPPPTPPADPLAAPKTKVSPEFQAELNSVKYHTGKNILDAKRMVEGLKVDPTKPLQVGITGEVIPKPTVTANSYTRYDGTKFASLSMPAETPAAVQSALMENMQNYLRANGVNVSSQKLGFDQRTNTYYAEMVVDPAQFEKAQKLLSDLTKTGDMHMTQAELELAKASERPVSQARTVDEVQTIMEGQERFFETNDPAILDELERLSRDPTKLTDRLYDHAQKEKQATKGETPPEPKPTVTEEKPAPKAGQQPEQPPEQQNQKPKTVEEKAAEALKDGPNERKITIQQRYIIDQANALNRLAKTSPEALKNLGLTEAQIQGLSNDPKNAAEMKAWQENVRDIGAKLKETGKLNEFRTMVDGEISKSLMGEQPTTASGPKAKPSTIKRVATMDGGGPGGLLAIAIGVPHLIEEWKKPNPDMYEVYKGLTLTTTGTSQILGEAMKPPPVPKAPPVAPGAVVPPAAADAAKLTRVQRAGKLFEKVGWVANPAMIWAGADQWKNADKTDANGERVIKSDANYYAQKTQAGTAMALGTHGTTQLLVNGASKLAGKGPVNLPGGGVAGAAGFGLLAFTLADEGGALLLGRERFFDAIEKTEVQFKEMQASQQAMLERMEAGRRPNGIPDAFPAQNRDYQQISNVAQKMAGKGLGKYDDLMKLPPKELDKKISEYESKLIDDFNTTHKWAMDHYTDRRLGALSDVAHVTAFMLDSAAGNPQVDRFNAAVVALKDLEVELAQARGAREELTGMYKGKYLTPDGEQTTETPLSLKQRNKRFDDLKKNDPELASALETLGPIYRKQVAKQQAALRGDKSISMSGEELRLSRDIPAQLYESQLKDMQAKIAGGMTPEAYFKAQKERAKAAGLDDKLARSLLIMDEKCLEYAVSVHNLKGLNEIAQNGKSDIKPIDMETDLKVMPPSITEVTSDAYLNGADGKGLKMVELPGGVKMLEITPPKDSDLAFRLAGQGMEVTMLPDGKIAVPVDNLQPYLSKEAMQKLETGKQTRYSTQQSLAQQEQAGVLDDFTIKQLKQRAASQGYVLQTPPAYDAASKTFHLVLREPTGEDIPKGTHPDKEIVLHAKANGETFDIQQVELRSIPGPNQPLVAGTYIKPNPPLNISPNNGDGMKGLPAAVEQVKQTHDVNGKAAFEAIPYRQLDEKGKNLFLKMKRNEDEVAIIERIQKQVTELEKTQGKGNVKLEQLNLTREEASALFRLQGRELGVAHNGADEFGGTRFQYDKGKVFIDEYQSGENVYPRRKLTEFTNINSDQLAGRLAEWKSEKVTLERAFYKHGNTLPPMPEGERNAMQQRHSGMLADIKKLEDAFGKDSPVVREATSTLRARIDMERTGTNAQDVVNQGSSQLYWERSDYAAGALSRAVSGKEAINQLITQLDKLPPDKRDAALTAAIATNRTAAQNGQVPVFGGDVDTQAALIAKLSPDERIKWLSANNEINKIYADKKIEISMISSSHSDWAANKFARDDRGKVTGFYDYQRQLDALAAMKPEDRNQVLASNARINDDYAKKGMKPPLVDSTNMEALVTSYELKRPEALYANKQDMALKTDAANKLDSYYVYLANNSEARANRNAESKLLIPHNLLIDYSNPTVDKAVKDLLAKKEGAGMIPTSQEQVAMIREMHAQLKADLISGREVRGTKVTLDDIKALENFTEKYMGVDLTKPANQQDPKLKPDTSLLPDLENPRNAFKTQTAADAAKQLSDILTKDGNTKTLRELVDINGNGKLDGRELKLVEDTERKLQSDIKQMEARILKMGPRASDRMREDLKKTKQALDKLRKDATEQFGLTLEEKKTDKASTVAAALDELKSDLKDVTDQKLEDSTGEREFNEQMLRDALLVEQNSQALLDAARADPNAVPLTAENEKQLVAIRQQAFDQIMQAEQAIVNGKTVPEGQEKEASAIQSQTARAAEELLPVLNASDGKPPINLSEVQKETLRKMAEAYFKEGARDEGKLKAFADAVEKATGYKIPQDDIISPKEKSSAKPAPIPGLALAEESGVTTAAKPMDDKMKAALAQFDPSQLGGSAGVVPGKQRSTGKDAGVA